MELIERLYSKQLIKELRILNSGRLIFEKITRTTIFLAKIVPQSTASDGKFWRKTAFSDSTFSKINLPEPRA
jgi:hypothetical protein